MSEQKIYITDPDKIESVKCEMECQETSVHWLRGDTHAIVCVSDNTVITRLVKAMRHDPDNYKCYFYESSRDRDSGKLANYFFEVPHKLVSFRSKIHREYTDEQKAAMRDRLLSRNSSFDEEDDYDLDS